MKKQTAVEWFKDEINKRIMDNSKYTMTEIFDQAKAMEKDQIIDAYKIGYDEGLQIITKYENVEDYYTSTYNNTQS